MLLWLLRRDSGSEGRVGGAAVIQVREIFMRLSQQPGFLHEKSYHALYARLKLLYVCTKEIQLNRCGIANEASQGGLNS